MQTMTFDDGAELKGPLGLRSPSDAVFPAVIANSTAVSATIPSGATKVVMAATGGNDFWVQLDKASFSIPSSSANAAGAGPMLNPSCLGVQGHANVCVNSSANCTIYLEFYS